MSQKTDAQLTTAANVIQSETAEKANTATRIGTMFNDLNDSKINNDKIDTADTLDTSGKTVAGRDAAKNFALTAPVDGGASVTEIKSIRFLRGTSAQWTSANPTLADGKPGYETDTKRLKVGDGSTAWNSLPYIGNKYIGDWAGTSSLPTTGDGGNGPAGAPAKGDKWRLTNTVVIGTNVFGAGTVIEAATNSPGATTLANWNFYAMQTIV